MQNLFFSNLLNTIWLMAKSDIVFYGAGFFLMGILSASVGMGILISSLLSFLMAVIFLFFNVHFPNKKYLWLSGLAAVVILGNAYYQWRETELQNNKIIFGEKVEIAGIVKKAEQRLNNQKIILDDIQIIANRYPLFEYGDKIKAKGMIKQPEGEWAGYFSKEGITGLMQFPEITLIAKKAGSPIRGALYGIKSFFETSYKQVLPFEQAAFLSGLTLGSTAEFSDELREKLRLTGTTHLVALSGYNISIIAKAAAVILGSWWLTRRFSFVLSVLLILGFVIMTGAEASVVRAAIMAMVMLLADRVGRPYYFRNAVMLAALTMVLINPKILVFDIGFQLSFAALLGIIYFRPLLKKLLRFSDNPGFLNWREHFLTTTAAQFAVLPLVIYYFDYFSPLAILSNILILEFIPITMSLGFFIGFASLIAYPLAWIVSFPTGIFLMYELTIINLFAFIAKLI